MTDVIRAANINHAFRDGWWRLRTSGIKEDSRNGPVCAMPGPVVTEYISPTQRVLFNPHRDANAVFHLMEAIWMLAGQNKVEWLSQFSGNIASYAEPDGVMHGAYGHRWRVHFGFDQIKEAVDKLRSNPNTRQAVLQMWDPSADLLGYWRDIPCNTACYFDCRGGVLNMTVTCRSNDMLWGAYGANVVHFSVLQEVVAAGVGVPVGVYRQFSNNFHVYMDNDAVAFFMQHPPNETHDAYNDGLSGIKAMPLVQPWEDYGDFIRDCEDFVTGHTKFRTSFMNLVALPLKKAYLQRKAGVPWNIDGVPNVDWKLAFTQWVERRKVENEGK